MASLDKWQHTSNSLDADMSKTMKFFQRTGFGESRTFFGGAGIRLYMMGLGQGNRAAPPSWIQLSAVLVNVFKQLELGALVVDPIMQELIHSMGTLFVDDTDLYTWKDSLLDPGELWLQKQLELTQWSTLLNATGGALKPKKCFWYMLNYFSSCSYYINPQRLLPPLFQRLSQRADRRAIV